MIRQRQMGITELGMQPQCGIDSGLRFRQARVCFIKTKPIKLVVKSRCETMSERKLRIARDGLIEKMKRLLRILARIARPAPTKQIARAQIEIVCVPMFRGMHLHACFFRGRKIRA